MSIIGDNIRALRESHGLSQAELAEIAGVSRETVNKWESGTIANIRDSNIQRLRDHFELSVDDLRSSSAGLASRGRTPSNPPDGAKAMKPGKPAYLPLLGRVHAGDAREPDVLDNRVPVPEEVAARHPHAYFLQVEGTCMSRVYPEGCHILIDPDREPQTGSVAVVSIDGADYVMRRLYRGASVVVLSPDSYEDGYQDIVVGEGHTCEFVGTVVWYQPRREME